jgi:hypothetical protein
VWGWGLFGSIRGSLKDLLKVCAHQAATLITVGSAGSSCARRGAGRACKQRPNGVLERPLHGEGGAGGPQVSDTSQGRCCNKAHPAQGLPRLPASRQVFNERRMWAPRQLTAARSECTSACRQRRHLEPCPRSGCPRTVPADMPQRLQWQKQVASLVINVQIQRLVRAGRGRRGRSGQATFRPSTGFHPHLHATFTQAMILATKAKEVDTPLTKTARKQTRAPLPVSAQDASVRCNKLYRS